MEDMMTVGDIDAWGGGNAFDIKPLDMDIPQSMNQTEYDAWVAACRPKINGIKNPQLVAVHDASGYLLLRGNAEGLMVLREVVEEALMNATFAGSTQPGQACLVMSCLCPRPNDKDFCIKIHIDDFRDNKARLAKIWTHMARKNGEIVEHHDNP
jgi:hypothetical protein